MSHTPLPWFGSNQYEDQYGFTQMSIGPFVVEGDEDHVEETIAYVSGINHDCAANAELILRAVNNHEALLAALRPFAAFRMTPDHERQADDHRIYETVTTDGTTSITMGDLRRARAAIAKAEGHLDTHPSSERQRAR